MKTGVIVMKGLKMQKQSRTPFEQYIAAIELITEKSGTHYEVTPSVPGPPITVSHYRDVPETGYSVAFSFGLSGVDRPEWIDSRPELLICTNTNDNAWALAMGEVIRRACSRSLFEYGTVFRFGEQVFYASRMSEFFVYANMLLDTDNSIVELEDRRICWSQLYPIYSEEVALIRTFGANRFFEESHAALLDVTRAPVNIKAG